MKILGAILAGGQSRRFGSDKALALLGEKNLAAHVRDRLQPEVTAIISCGRPLLDLEGVPDRPGTGLGPLAGINAALQLAATRGFDAVLSVPCDTPDLPDDLVRNLRGDGAAIVGELPVIGFWPVSLADTLDRHLNECSDRSMRAWAERIGARMISASRDIANVNTPADLDGIRPR